MKGLIFIFILLTFGACIKAPGVNESSTYDISYSGAPVFNYQDNSLSFTINYKNAQSITLVRENVSLIKTGTVDGTLSVSGEGTATRVVTISNISGVGTFAISVAAGTALYTKTKLAKALGTSAVYTVQNLPPAISISAPSVARTASGPVSFTVTYTGANVVFLDNTFITLNTTGTANAAVAVTGTGAFTRTVTLSSFSGSGTIGFGIAANSAQSSVGLYSTVATSSTPTTVDNTAPVVTISAPSAAAVKSGSVTYTISYSDFPSISLSNSDVTLNTTGTATGTISVSGSGTLQRTVTISSIAGDGTLGISLGAGTAVDDLGNTSLAPSASSVFIVDNTAPTFTVSAPSAVSISTGAVNYTITYSGASSVTLNWSNITLNKTGTANADVFVTGTGATTRTVSLKNIAGDGTLGITIGAGTATDAAGNSAVAGSASAVTTVDNTSTGIAFSAPSAANVNSAALSVTYTVTYSDAVLITLGASDVLLTKTGTANAAVAVSGTTITFSSFTGNGTIAFKLRANTATDALGNQAQASGSSLPFTVDNIAPTLSLSSPSSVNANSSSTITYTATYGGADTINLLSANVSLNKTGTADATTVTIIAATATTKTISISGITGNGTIGITVAAATASDNAGNTSLGASSTTLFNVDNIAPTFTVSAPTRLATTAGPINYILTYTGASNISLTSSNITFNKTGTTNVGSIIVSGADLTTRTVILNNITGDGTIGINVDAGTASDAAGNTAAAFSTSSTFYVASDPLFAYSWHLYNTGQNAFSPTNATPGYDLNLLKTYKAGYKGSGINILVSDTGVQSAHEDLAANFLGGTVSVDYMRGDAASVPSYAYATAEPDLTTSSAEHGTAVAGILAAVAGNGLGGQGVAPLAKIASANYILSLQNAAANIAQITGNFSIINQSWGQPQCAVGPPDTAYESKMKSDRKVYVKAAGNSFGVDTANCRAASAVRVGNSVFDQYDNNPYTIMVGALNASGVKASYSSPGSNIWITALGGEFGDDFPAIITTDLSGCTYGSSPLENYNNFQTAAHPLNTHCNYTSVMNGTSAATPMISGVAALLLEANSSLTARDIKHILATTAKKVNPTAGVTTNPYVTSPSGHVWQQGWVTNAAGYPFHNYYGFGLVDTDAAVVMATSGYVALGTESQVAYLSGTVNLSIPDNSATGVQSTITSASALTVEAIQITPTITHADIGQLGIELTSPSGTKSIIVNVNNSLKGLTDFSGEVFLTNAFYGESATGVWTIKVIDGLGGTTGTLNSWKINIIGH